VSTAAVEPGSDVRLWFSEPHEKAGVNLADAPKTDSANEYRHWLPSGTEFRTETIRSSGTENMKRHMLSV
jgi:hypothetical protein